MRRKPRQRRRGTSSAARLAVVLAVPALIVTGALWAASGLFDKTAMIAEATAARATPLIEDDLFPPAIVGVMTATPVDGSAGALPAISTEAALEDELAAALETGSTIRSRAVVSRHGVLLGVTRTLPDDSSILGRYVNVRFALRPEAGGMRVTRMAVGRYEVPGGWIPTALALWRRWLPGASDALSLLADIDSIDPEARTVTRNAMEIDSGSPEDRG